MKPKKWEIVPIRRVYQALYDGPHATPKPALDGPVFLGIKNITEDGKLDLSDTRHIAEEDFPKWIKRVEPKAGDIVFSYEATLHRYAIIPKGFRGCLGRRLALIRPDPKEIDTRFLFHYFFGKEWRRTISAHMVSGATVDRIPLIKFPSFEIVKPPLPIQRRIGAILSAYDDLIENNTRRIQILEEMTRRIYEEWFVRFRFPGHENVRMVESELRLIPAGWEVKKLGLLIKRLTAGNTYRDRDIRTEGDVIVVDQSTSEYLGFHNNQPDHHANPERPIIIFGDHTCKLQVMITPFSIGANTVPFVANEGTSIYYLYNLIKGLVTTREYKRHWTELNNKTVIKASSKLCVQYDELVRPFFGAMDVFRTKNRNLRRTRDLLLPKLISGEIDVSNFPEPVTD